jgi:uncharacterized protein with FMN-binding domain
VRRPAAAATGLLIGAVLLVGARLAARTPADLGGFATGSPSAATEADPSPQRGFGPAPSRGREPAPTAKAPATGAPASAPPGTRAPSAPPDPGTPSGTFVGDAVTHQYGTLRLTVTIEDGQITDVQAEYDTSSPVSTRINDDALPRLRQEALVAQSAEVDTISGATYTSDAYRSSLQSALDQAG